MTTYYELLPDNTIGRSTPCEKIARDLGLSLTTDSEIVYGYDGKRYFKGQEPEKPQDIIDEEIDAKKQKMREKLIDRFTLRRIRKIANHTWTEEDEQEYLNLDVYVTGLIEKKFGV